MKLCKGGNVAVLTKQNTLPHQDKLLVPRATKFQNKYSSGESKMRGFSPWVGMARDFRNESIEK